MTRDIYELWQQQKQLKTMKMRLDLIFTIRDKYTLFIHPLTKFSSSKSTMSKYVMRCAIRYYLYKLFVICYLFLKLYKWYQMAQNITYIPSWNISQMITMTVTINKNIITSIATKRSIHIWRQYKLRLQNDQNFHWWESHCRKNVRRNSNSKRVRQWG